MANDGPREHQLARPQRAENPLHPKFTLSASHGDIESLIRMWDRDIVRAAHAVVKRDHGLSADAADECAQAARLALARIAHRADQVGPFYQRRVIQNAVRDAARRERRSYGRGSPFDNATADVASEAPAEDRDDDVSRVSMWVATLPRRLQEIYEFLYVRGCSQRQVAAAMGVSQPRIAQLHRALLMRGRAELSDLAA